MKSLFTSVVGLFFCALPLEAGAVGHIASQGKPKPRVRAVTVTVSMDGPTTQWTVQSSMGSRGAGALLIPIRDLVSAEAAAPDVQRGFDRARRFSAPRLEEFIDGDPCGPPHTPGRPATDLAWRKTPAGDNVVWAERDGSTTPVEVHVITGPLASWLSKRKLQITDAAKKDLGGELGRKNKIVAITWARQKHKLHELAPVVIRMKRAQPLDLARLKKYSVPGRIVHASLIGLTNKFQVLVEGLSQEVLPAGLPLPEHVFDDIRNTRNAIRQLRLSKATKPSFVLEHASPTGACDPCVEQPLQQKELALLGAGNSNFITRLFVAVSHRHVKKPIVLGTTRNKRVTQSRWFFRRPWRKPLSCPAPGYIGQVAKRQIAEARNLASLIGRSVADVAREAQELGYAIQGDGTLKPLKK